MQISFSLLIHFQCQIPFDRNVIYVLHCFDKDGIFSIVKVQPEQDISIWQIIIENLMLDISLNMMDILTERPACLRKVTDTHFSTILAFFIGSLYENIGTGIFHPSKITYHIS